MHEVAAYSTLAMTLGLVVTRPRMGWGLRLSPAAAALTGVTLLALLGVVHVGHLRFAAAQLRSPFITIAAIMVMTAAADRVGLLAWWAARIADGAASTPALFRRVFVLGAVTSSALTNDAAILLLTPIVLTIVARRYPHTPALRLPFAFAVFASAGVAALPVANPMNMVVAEATGLAWSTYVAHMLPIALAVSVTTYAILRRVFARALAAPLPPAAAAPPPMTRAQAAIMVLLAAVLIGYPVAALRGAPLWPVALAGAVVSLLIVAAGARKDAVAVLTEGVSVQTLVFLLAVLVMALGLRDVGLVARLGAAYDGGSVWTIGAASAAGSALINNHPMALLNMLAIGRDHDPQVLAALIGGDLGPRLLPMGSLAGLLWLAQVRRYHVDVGLGRFMALGAITAIPTVALALAMLTLW